MLNECIPFNRPNLPLLDIKTHPRTKTFKISILTPEKVMVLVFEFVPLTSCFIWVLNFKPSHMRLTINNSHKLRAVWSMVSPLKSPPKSPRWEHNKYNNKYAVWISNTIDTKHNGCFTCQIEFNLKSGDRYV